MCKFCDTRVKAPADTGGSATTHAAPGQMPAGIGQAGRKTLIRGGHVLSMDAAVGNFTKGDVLIDGSKILAIAAHIDAGDAAVICSIMRDDGEMARLEDIGELIAAHGLAVAEIGELIARLERADA